MIIDKLNYNKTIIFKPQLVLPKNKEKLNLKIQNDTASEDDSNQKMKKFI